MRLVAGLVSIAAAAPLAHAELPAPDYPREVLARPTTYPAGVATAGLDVEASAPSFGDHADLHVLAGLGLTDRLELSFGHRAFSAAHPGRAALDVGLAVDLAHLYGDLDFGVKATSGYHLSTGAVDPLSVGVLTQYDLTDVLAVIAPGDQVAIGLARDQVGLALRLPLALGFQAHPLVFLQLDTTVASLDVGRGAARVMFADTTPVALTAFVNVVPALDVFAGVSADLTPPDAPGDEDDAAPSSIADTLGMVVGARYYFGVR